YFLYTDEGLSGEYNHKGKAIKTYVYKPGSAWTTDSLFMKIGRKYYYYHNDHLGTPQKLTDKKGKVFWEAVYDAFGEVSITQESKIENNLRFPGQYFDRENGLNYNWHRFYGTDTGTYLRTDPTGLNGGVNPYFYAANNPINFIDPFGLQSGPIGGLIIPDGPNGEGPFIGPASPKTNKRCGTWKTKFSNISSFIECVCCATMECIQFVSNKILKTGTFCGGVVIGSGLCAHPKEGKPCCE
ncbi:MAG: hypothetical protein GY705_30670, partial [Bacteroidetes bacterium]|nr:hypothetical protein [Bacteroidota bacterium]